MMKKIVKIMVIIAVTIFIALAGLYFVGSGFLPRTDMGLGEYSVSEDGKSMTITAGVMSSAGAARSCKASYEGENAYLTFFTTFGGFNSLWGAKNEFSVELPEDCSKIYFYRGERKKCVLEKNTKTGTWERREE